MREAREGWRPDEVCGACYHPAPHAHHSPTEILERPTHPHRGVVRLQEGTSGRSFEAMSHLWTPDSSGNVRPRSTATCRDRPCAARTSQWLRWGRRKAMIEKRCDDAATVATATFSTATSDPRSACTFACCGGPCIFKKQALRTPWSGPGSRPGRARRTLHTSRLRERSRERGGSTTGRNGRGAPVTIITLEGKIPATSPARSGHDRSCSGTYGR